MLNSIDYRKWYNRKQINYDSRAALTMSSHFLGLKLKQKKIPIHVNSLHPGFLQRKSWADSNSILCKIGAIKNIADKFLTVKWNIETKIMLVNLVCKFYLYM